MPTTATRYVTSVENTVKDPLQHTPDAYSDAAAYIGKLPEATGDARADQLKGWFLGRAKTLDVLDTADRSYVVDRSIRAALEIGTLLGDLETDWRR